MFLYTAATIGTYSTPGGRREEGGLGVGWAGGGGGWRGGKVEELAE